MKNVYKIILPSIVIGLILVIMGLLFGAKLWVFADLDGIHVVDTKKRESEHIITELDLEEFSNIQIDASYADIEIIESDKFGIDIRYVGEDRKPIWSLKDGNLNIQEEKGRIAFFNINFNFFNWDYKNTITVYIPKDAQLQNVKLNTSSGNINIDRLNADSTKINNEYGKVIGQKVIFQDSKIYAGSGAIELDGEFLGNTKISSDYGKITLNILGQRNYYFIKAQTDYGKIKIDNNTIGDSTHYISDNSSEHTLDVKASSGSININFI